MHYHYVLLTICIYGSLYIIEHIYCHLLYDEGANEIYEGRTGV